MDKFTGAFNSFTGGDNNNQQQSQEQGGYPEGNQQSQQSQNNNGGGGAGGLLGGLGFGGGNSQQGQGQGQSSGGGGFLGGLGDKMNSAAGGGRESEKNEDYLDKGELIPLLPSSHDPVVAELTFDSHRYGAAEIHGPGTAG